VTVTEDGTTSASRNVSAAASDVDGDDLTFSIQGSGVGTYGTPSVTGAGVWSYTLNNNAAVVQALTDGETKTDTFTLQVSDGNGGTATTSITVNVQGNNDVPVIPAVTIQADENYGAVSVSNVGVTPIAYSVDLASVVTDAEDAATSLIYSINTPIDQEGTFTLAGSVLKFDPGASFQYLGREQTTTVATSLTVTDSESESTTGTVTVIVTGTNDVPVANSDTATTVENPSGSAPVTVTMDVLDNDFDYDGNASITLSMPSNPAHGTAAVGTDGRGSPVLEYTPEDDFFGFDTFTYQISDEFGATSSATVTVFVQEAQAPPPNGFSASLTFYVDGDANHPAGSLEVETLGVSPNKVQIAFVLDASGSIGSANWDIIESAVAGAVDDLGGLFVGSQTELEVKLIQFSGSVTFNSDPPYTIVSPTDTAADTSALDRALLESVSFTGGGTNWNAAFNAAETYFVADTTNAIQVMYFVTDGNPNSTAANGTWDETSADLRGDGVDINVFAIGGYVDDANINLIEGNPATDPVNTLASAADLTDSFAASPLFNPVLDDFILDIVSDGVLFADITLGSTLVAVSGLNYDLALADINGLADILGDSNQFIATAVYDVGAVDLVEIVEVGDLSKFSTAQDRQGTDGNDLILGSDFADTIDGGLGNDLILAYAGDDEIMVGGDTAAAIDGGDGRDVLSLSFVGVIDLQGLNAANVEVLDLTNGDTQTLTMTTNDLLGLSGDGDVDLNAILTANGITSHGMDETTTILGDSNDQVQIALTASQELVQIGDTAGYTYDASNDVKVYQIQEGVSGGGFDVLATLGIDSDLDVTSNPMPT